MPDGSLSEWDPGQFTAIGKRGAFAVRADKEKLYVAWPVNGGQPRRTRGLFDAGHRRLSGTGLIPAH
jgi:hypothetical protein